MGGEYINQGVAVQALIRRAALARDLAGLQALCMGLVADRRLTVEEVRYLDLWLAEHQDVASMWPGDVVAARITEARADGHIDADELEHLRRTLDDLIGGSLEEDGAIAAVTRLPIDDSIDVVIPGANICVTGDFLFGPRRRVASVIELAGGRFADSITRSLDFLVIGQLGSAAYRGGSYGAKIQKAVDYQRAGCRIGIISEERWAAAIRAAEAR